MIKKFTRRQKTPAQAMVEFALVLPILLLVVYGLLEVGRLLFIYSSVVTSARSASRYGSTTGLNDAGSFPRYQDCAGMRAAARNSAFIDSYEDADIQIQWDKGEGQSTTSYCTSGASDISFNLQDDGCSGNNCRVRVTVSTQYTPIVPLVPLEPFVITSTSARTILVSVAIQMTSPPMTWDPNVPTFTPIPSATLVPSATSTLQYTPTPTDTATPTLSPTATLSPTITQTPTETGTPTNTATATQPVPADFVKSGPDNGAGNQPVALTLTWSSSTGASYYEYCLSTSLPCSGWSSTGLTTNAALSGLSPNTTYYWHVRAVNIYGQTYSNGSTTEVWSFTTGGACDVRHSTPIKFSGASLNMTIFNYSATTTIHISSLQLYWNPSSPAGQYLSEITLGGISIWTGNVSSQPTTISSFIGDVSISPSASKLISFNFSKTYKDNGSERILITFAESGCPTLDSENDSQLP